MRSLSSRVLSTSSRKTTACGWVDRFNYSCGRAAGLMPAVLCGPARRGSTPPLARWDRVVPAAVGLMSWSASGGPQVPGSYSWTGATLPRHRSTTRQAASTASSRANRVGSPSASPRSRSYGAISSGVWCRATSSTFSPAISSPGVLARVPRAIDDLGAEPEAQVVRLAGLAARPKTDCGGRLELDHAPRWRSPAGTCRRGCRRARRPSARCRCKSRTAAKVSTWESGRHAGSCAVAAELAAHDVCGVERPHGLEHLGLLVADRLGVGAGRRFHGQQGDHLQHVVLHHVADRAGLFVEAAAARARRSSRPW